MSKRNLLLLALLVSVSVNLLIAGVVIGRKGFEGHKPPPPMAWASERLDPKTRAVVSARMRERLPAMRPLRARLRQTHEDVRQVLRADVLDSEALHEALRRMRDASAAYQAEIHNNLVDLAEELPASERMALISRALLRDTAPRRPDRPRMRKAPQS